MVSDPAVKLQGDGEAVVQAHRLLKLRLGNVDDHVALLQACQLSGPAGPPRRSAPFLRNVAVTTPSNSALKLGVAKLLVRLGEAGRCLWQHWLRPTSSCCSARSRSATLAGIAHAHEPSLALFGRRGVLELRLGVCADRLPRS